MTRTVMTTTMTRTVMITTTKHHFFCQYVSLSVLLADFFYTGTPFVDFITKSKKIN